MTNLISHKWRNLLNMVLRENNCGLKDIFCKYKVLGVGCSKSVLLLCISLSNNIISVENRSSTSYSYLSFFSVSLVGFSFFLCKQVSLFHHSDRVSLLKTRESTDNKIMYADSIFNNGVHLITVSTNKKLFLFKQSLCDSSLYSPSIT